MRKHVVLLLQLILLPVVVHAQFDPQIGQYMYIPTAYNPAAAGEGDLMKVMGLHRMQYVNITNAPMTTYFSFSSPFVIGKTKHAAGVRFMNDMYGLFTNQTFHIQYAYRHRIGKGYLSAGVDLGFVSVGFKGDSTNLNTLSASEYFDVNDPAIPKSSVAAMSFDMGIGVYYYTNVWWAGISYSHLTQPRVEWSSGSDLQSTEVKLTGTMYIAGGYNFKIKHHEDWHLKPSMLVMTDFASWDIDLNLLCEYKNRYRWGLGYRIAGAVNILLGVDIVSGLQIGYSCELPHNKLLLESYGTHEIFLAYGFDILKPKRTNKYKSIRYL